MTSVPARAILIAVLIHSLWGGNPVAVKFSLLVFPPMWTAFLRFLIAVACIAAWAKLSGVRLLPRRNEWQALGWIGLLFTAQIATMNIGFALTTASMGAVLIATHPLFAVLFAHFLISGDRMTVSKVAGLALAMLGTGLILLRETGFGGLGFGTPGNAVVVGSACLLGLRLALTARMLQEIDEVRVAAWQMLISLPLFAAGGLAFETIHWEHLTWEPVAGLLYQGVIIAGVGFMVSFHLMKRYTPSVMMSFSFVSPAAGVLLGAWLLGERMTFALIAGLLLIALGLVLIAKR